MWKRKEEWSPDISAESWPDDVPDFYEMAIVKGYLCVIGKKTNRQMNTYHPWYESTLYIFNAADGQLVKKVEYTNKRITINVYDDTITIADIDSKKISLCEIVGAE